MAFEGSHAFHTARTRVAMICSEAALPHCLFRRAWPLRAILSSPSSKKPVGFRAITLGGELIVQEGNTPIAFVHRYASLSSPSEFPVRPQRRSSPVSADGRDSLELVVGQNPAVAFIRSARKGRWFTARLVAAVLLRRSVLGLASQPERAGPP